MLAQLECVTNDKKRQVQLKTTSSPSNFNAPTPQWTSRPRLAVRCGRTIEQHVQDWTGYRCTRWDPQHTGAPEKVRVRFLICFRLVGMAETLPVIALEHKILSNGCGCADYAVWRGRSPRTKLTKPARHNHCEEDKALAIRPTKRQSPTVLCISMMLRSEAPDRRTPFASDTPQNRSVWCRRHCEPAAVTAALNNLSSFCDASTTGLLLDCVSDHLDGPGLDVISTTACDRRAGLLLVNHYCNGLVPDLDALKHG
jgi:hypothetical protein